MAFAELCDGRIARACDPASTWPHRPVPHAESGRRYLTVARIQNRVCDTCGKAGVCYLTVGRWNCSGCATARVATGSLAAALEVLAEIARDGQKETKSLAQALRRGAANSFWGGMLQGMADRIDASAAEQEARETGNGAVAETKDSRMDEACLTLLEKAQSMTIKYDFPDLATAYEKGREYGPGLDKEYGELHDTYVGRCEVRGYVPCKPREFKVPDEQRWAVNYLRHKCSSYEDACGRLQDEAQGQLEPDSPRPDWEGFHATSEMIHQVIKNRVQEQIEAQFPELADAAKEQMV